MFREPKLETPRSILRFGLENWLEARPQDDDDSRPGRCGWRTVEKTTVLLTGGEEEERDGQVRSISAGQFHHPRLGRDKPFIEGELRARPETLLESHSSGHVKGASPARFADQDGPVHWRGDGGTGKGGNISPTRSIRPTTAMQGEAACACVARSRPTFEAGGQHTGRQ